MASMNRALFKKQLQLGLNTVFGLEYKRYPEEWRAIFDVESSAKAYEEDVLQMGLGAAQVKPEGRGVSYDQGGEVWTARYNHETIALACAFTEEAMEDNLYMDQGKKYAAALARSLQHTKEIKGANILNNAFTAGAFAGGDGVALLSTAHPLAGGGTFANRLTVDADLAEASLEDIDTLIQTMVDERGIPVAAQGLKVIVPPQLAYTAERLLTSPGRPGTPDNDVNALKGMGRFPGGYTVNRRITDTNSWYIKTDVPNGMKHFVRKPVSGGMEGDFESGNLRFKKRERYSFGFTDPRGLVGSSGSS